MAHALTAYRTPRSPEDVAGVEASPQDLRSPEKRVRSSVRSCWHTRACCSFQLREAESASPSRTAAILWDAELKCPQQISATDERTVQKLIKEDLRQFGAVAVSCLPVSHHDSYLSDSGTLYGYPDTHSTSHAGLNLQLQVICQRRASSLPLMHLCSVIPPLYPGR